MKIGTADGDDLKFELDPEALLYTLTDYVRQCKHVGGPGSPQVADEVGMLGGNLGGSDLEPLQSAGLDELAGPRRRRVLEGAPQAPHPGRLAGLSLGHHPPNLGPCGVGIARAESNPDLGHDRSLERPLLEGGPPVAAAQVGGSEVKHVAAREDRLHSLQN